MNTAFSNTVSLADNEVSHNEYDSRSIHSYLHDQSDNYECYAQPIRLLVGLCRAQWSGRLELRSAVLEMKVWLSEGRVVWATRSPARVSFARTVSDLLQVDRAALRALTDSWRLDNIGFVQGVCSMPGVREERAREVMRAYLFGVFEGLTEAPSVDCRLVANRNGPDREPDRWSFSLFDVVSVPSLFAQPSAFDDERPSGVHIRVDASLESIGARASGASEVRVLTDGAQVLGADTHSSWLESVDDMLFAPLTLAGGPADELRRLIVQTDDASWAGWKMEQAAHRTSTWLRYERETPLGNVLFGLRAASQSLAPEAQTAKPRRNAARVGDVRRCERLEKALELAEDYLSAHLVVGDAIRWSSQPSLAHASSCDEMVLRASKLLHGRPCDAAPVPRVVWLERGDRFHVGAGVAGNLSLFLTFPLDARCGLALAALRAGLEVIESGQRN